MNHLRRESVLPLCCWQSPAGGRRACLALFTIAQPRSLQASEKSSTHTRPAQEAQIQDLCPQHHLQSHCAKVVPGKETEIPQPCPLAWAPELREMSGWMQSWPPPPPSPPAGNSSASEWMWSSPGPACVQGFWSEREAGVTTQSYLPCWESRESVQPKST